MTRPNDGAGHDRQNAILIVSQREAFAQSITEILPSDGQANVTRRDTSFAALNGQAAAIAGDFDVVIFDSDPDNQAELDALRSIVAERGKDTVFIALTDNDVSIAKARNLTDAGVDDVLPMSISREALRAVIDDRIAAHRSVVPETTGGDGRLGRIIAVTQARGGIGATTVAVNLACALTGKRGLFGRSPKNPARVALLDLDLQFGNANVFLDLEDNGGLLQLVDAVDAPDQRLLQSVLQHHSSGVDVLCAPTPVVPLQSAHADTVEAVLNMLQRDYDYIVVDLPRALVDWVAPVLGKASSLTVVADTSVPCIRQARRLMDFYREDNVGLPVDIVVNREKRPMIKSEHIREAEKILETKLTHWLPDNPRVARHAVDLGQPIVDKHAASDLGKAITRMAATMTANLETGQAQSARGR